MNDLVVVQKIAGWQRLKRLVLDSLLADYASGVQLGAT
jgi:hypothetical protein